MFVVAITEQSRFRVKRAGRRTRAAFKGVGVDLGVGGAGAAAFVGTIRTLGTTPDIPERQVPQLD